MNSQSKDEHLVEFFDSIEVIIKLNANETTSERAMFRLSEIRELIDILQIIGRTIENYR